MFFRAKRLDVPSWSDNFGDFFTQIDDVIIDADKLLYAEKGCLTKYKGVNLYQYHTIILTFIDGVEMLIVGTLDNLDRALCYDGCDKIHNLPNVSNSMMETARLASENGIEL